MILAHSLGRAARYYADSPALSSRGVRVTFRELHGRVARAAAALSELGLCAGDRLALLLPNEPEYLELVYACAWLGVIAVPLNTRLTSVEIDRVLDDARPSGLIRHSALPAPKAPLPWQLVLDQEPLDHGGGTCAEAIYDPDAVLALIYTSGTTGRPKGVMLTHAAMLANIDHLNYWVLHRDGGVYLHAAPLFHIADLPFVFAAPALGVCQVTAPKFSPDSFCQTVQNDRVTCTVLVPTMINLLTRFPQLDRYDLSSLKVLGYGGSPIAPEVIRRVREAFPHLRLLQVYGLSETGFLTALQDEEHTSDKLLSCGRPCPGIDVRVVDESGSELGVGRAGEFVARGANVMRSYWNNPEETARVFRNGQFRTGDVGYRDADGYLYILDRLKDMIVTGGENVYSGEVEAVLYEHPAILEAAVFGIPDSTWGELVMACVVLKPDTVVTIEEIAAHCRRRLATYKVPRRVELLQGELPKTGSGKIFKRPLRERYWSGQGRAVG
ncbi:MAG: long-chain fatty acid--CoA ligase [Gammaproteobacteria bacterium]